MAELRIELIAVGDELLMGMTLDTNSHYIAQALASHGLRLQRLIWVADREEDIKAALDEAWSRADIVLMTGGLGPTHDDMTRPVIAAYFNDRLEIRADLRDGILKRFENRGLKPAPGWEIMAEFPTMATPIPNDRGAAPGIHYRRDNHELFAVPGVPTEMKGMIDNYIIPIIAPSQAGGYRYRVIKTVGIGESHLAVLIGDPAKLLPVGLAFLPSIDHGVTLRLSSYDNSSTNSEEALLRVEEIVSRAVQPYIYAKSDILLEAVIVELFRAKRLQMALAESCTGGMIAARIVNVPGSSEVLNRGVVSYSNQAKIDLAGVPSSVIEEFGAVSEEVARSMAQGIRQESGVDIGLSVTGIAGPGGATETKPVGLTFIGIADATGCTVTKYMFAGNRDENRRRATLAALTVLFKKLSA